mmetsp:Transcript_97814/g.279755  ORF Transcript_97814/g.279755 Transcript_97814/m.279755 type:complete len:328 (+) Transcript_97814:1427-2410(+)
MAMPATPVSSASASASASASGGCGFQMFPHPSRKTAIPRGTKLATNAPKPKDGSARRPGTSSGRKLIGTRLVPAQKPVSIAKKTPAKKSEPPSPSALAASSLALMLSPPASGEYAASPDSERRRRRRPASASPTSPADDSADEDPEASSGPSRGLDTHIAPSCVEKTIPTTPSTSTTTPRIASHAMLPPPPVSTKRLCRTSMPHKNEVSTAVPHQSPCAKARPSLVMAGNENMKEPAIRAPPPHAPTTSNMSGLSKETWSTMPATMPVTNTPKQTASCHNAACGGLLTSLNGHAQLPSKKLDAPASTIPTRPMVDLFPATVPSAPRH